MKWFREIRILPIALIAIGCLFALKALGLMFDGGYTLGQRLGRTDNVVVTTVPWSQTQQLTSQTTPLEVASAKPAPPRSWMQEMFNYPDPNRPAEPSANSSEIVTGSVTPPKPPAAAATNPAAPPVPAPPDTTPAAAAAPPGPNRPVSPAERAILERLQDRRQELDARARELDIRETLIKAAEQKLEARIAELKAMEVRLSDGAQQRNDADAVRLKGLITMYETMKPKEAAKIFERLDMKVLLEVAARINPRRMSEIMAQMSAEAAEKLTVELATRLSPSERAANPADLPKIDGKPNGT